MFFLDIVRKHDKVLEPAFTSLWDGQNSVYFESNTGYSQKMGYFKEGKDPYINCSVKYTAYYDDKSEKLYKIKYDKHGAINLWSVIQLKYLRIAYKIKKYFNV